MPILKVNSNTHYGRGTKPNADRVRKNIRAARYLLDLLVPDLPVYGFCDEDYGWLVVLTKEQVDALLQRYPASLEDCGYYYLNSGAGEYADMFYFDFEGEQMSEMVNIEFDERLNPSAIAKPVDREKLFDDWFDNYGSH